MAISGLDLEEFKQILRENLTPAQAISNPQQLRGRESMLRKIDRAFNSPGMHVFIYGDRGVGKTSLAQSAAVLHQSSDADPILVACDPQVSFFKLVQDMVNHCVPVQQVGKKREKLSINVPGISYELADAIEGRQVPEPRSINDAISFMKYVRRFHSKEPIIIIDEFDQLKSDGDKKYFADFVKQLSDQGVGIRLIFCGIGSSLEELIGTHLSTDRYLTPIELERLSHDARWEIITSAAEELRISVDKEYLVRIGQISDGFPYYVHLICEMMFWAIYDDPCLMDHCESPHFSTGVRGAVSNVQTSLRFVYDKATQKYSDDYQEVLWAVSDHVILRRQVSEIYDQSYLRIMKARPQRKTLRKEQFYNRMNALKTPRHGAILIAKGAGWYEFRENVVRGYVRLRAEDQGIKLGLDHFAPT